MLDLFWVDRSTLDISAIVIDCEDLGQVTVVICKISSQIYIQN
jgi:hypothetical protein